ncbi:MerR family DNA-binding protein [Streptomyces tendae]|uniref:MerR family DNA-binding protein n=1 Tax=Streptomyces tendae TaxID=1932 RepID=UPI0036C95A05
MPLGDVAAVFSTLPTDRAPTHKDWQRLSLAWKAQLEDRRRAIEALEHELTGCIGCGCLSMKACLLLNPDDSLGEQGPGPVRLQNTTPTRHSRRT